MTDSPNVDQSLAQPTPETPSETPQGSSKKPLLMAIIVFLLLAILGAGGAIAYQMISGNSILPGSQPVPTAQNPALTQPTSQVAPTIAPTQSALEETDTSTPDAMDSNPLMDASDSAMEEATDPAMLP
jgi:cytoskeletal protein RodZ